METGHPKSLPSTSSRAGGIEPTYSHYIVSIVVPFLVSPALRKGTTMETIGRVLLMRLFEVWTFPSAYTGSGLTLGGRGGNRAPRRNIANLESFEVYKVQKPEKGALYSCIWYFGVPRQCLTPIIHPDLTSRNIPKPFAYIE